MKNNTPHAATKIVSIEAVNYTPLMIGGPTGHVRVEYGESYRVIAHPAKAIIGRSRWLLRILVQDLGLASTHREADTQPPIRVAIGDGGLGGRSVELGLAQLIYGTLKPTPWRALYTIRAIPVSINASPDARFTKKHGPRLTRFKLATMGVKYDEKLLKAPISPKGLGLRVEVLRRYYPKNKIKANLDKLDALVAGLTMATLRVLGLGQGANRGFGRFQLTNIKEDSRASEVRSLYDLMTGLDSANNNHAETLRKLIDRLQGLIVDAARMNKARPGVQALIDRRGIKVYDTRRINTRCIEASIYQKLPGLKDANLPPQPLYRSLELIALVTLKASWKNLNGEGRSGGGAYHTWILGLPRRQKQRVKEKKEKCLGSEEELPTGYLLEPSREEEANIVLKRVKASDGKTIYVSIKQNATKQGGIAFAEGRRQSPIILFPVDVNGHVIVVLPIKPHDMAELVERMCHAGGLVNTSGGSPIFIDAVRLERVPNIATSGTERIEHNCMNYTYVNDRATGVARPCTKTHNTSDCTGAPLSSDIVNEAYTVALDFIDAILTCRQCPTYGPRYGRQYRGSRALRRPRNRRW